MRRHAVNNPLALALWVNALVLTAILAVLISRGNSPAILPAALAQQFQNIGGGGGVYVMPAQFSPNQWGCYLIDIDQQNLIAYQFTPEKKLVFVAARSYKYDRKLTQYSTFPPPDEMKRLLEREAQGRNTPEPAPAVLPPPPLVTTVPADNGLENK